jgi:hypothetical protein
LRPRGHVHPSLRFLDPKREIHSRSAWLAQTCQLNAKPPGHEPTVIVEASKGEPLAEANACCPEGGHRASASCFPLGGRGT